MKYANQYYRFFARTRNGLKLFRTIVLLTKVLLKCPTKPFQDRTQLLLQRFFLTMQAWNAFGCCWNKPTVYILQPIKIYCAPQFKQKWVSICCKLTDNRILINKILHELVRFLHVMQFRAVMQYKFWKIFNNSFFFYILVRHIY